MNFKIVLILSLFYCCVYCEENIIRVSYVPVLSNIIETEIVNNGKVFYRVALCEQFEIDKIKIIGKNDEITEYFKDQKMLGGKYFVFIENIPGEPCTLTGSFKYISSCINSTNYIKIDEMDEIDVISSLNSGVTTKYKNLSIQKISGIGNSFSHPYYDELSGTSKAQRAVNYKNFLISKSIKCMDIYESNGSLVALIEFGSRVVSYAMYGIWESKTANKYGYQEGQRIYMSEGIRLPERAFATRYRINFNSDAAYKRTADFGEMHWSYEYIMAHKNETYPYLAWRPYPLNSKSEKKMDELGNVLPDKNGYIPPNSPDNKNNTNPPGLDECPDMDWYWDLFCDCAEAKFASDEFKVTSTQYQDYKDYLEIKVMENQYDPTIYGEDRSVSPQKISIDDKPVEPYLYTKDLVLLNKKFPMIYDPFAETTTFTLQDQYWENNPFEGMGWHTRTVSVKDKVQPIFYEIMNFYSKYAHDNEHLLEKLQAYKNIKNEGFEFFIKEGYEDKPLFLGNKADRNSIYPDARVFLIQDEYYSLNGHPFKVESYSIYNDRKEKIKAQVESQNDTKNWFLTWKWPIMYKDKYGIKLEVGSVDYCVQFWQEAGQALPSGKEVAGSKRNRYIQLGGDKLADEQIAGYDKESKDYYTDQYDVNERDNEIDKGEAAKELALKILVSEGLDQVMKGLHYIGTKSTLYSPVYEGAKRLENSFTQSKTYKLAKEVYKGYVFWKRTMDVAADLRDAYNSISEAWDGLLYATRNTWEYYKDFQWDKLRLTNCSMLLPHSKIGRIDAALNSLHAAFSNTGLAIYGCAFQADQLTRGNYGPLNPIIKSVTEEMSASLGTIHGETTEIISRNTNQLNQLTKKSGEGVSDQAYLSNIAAASHSLISTQRMKVNNEKIRNMGLALFLIETESRDWITYKNYWKNVGKNYDEAKASAQNKKSLMPMVMLFHTQSLFDQSRVEVMKEMVEKNE